MVLEKGWKKTTMFYDDDVTWLDDAPDTMSISGEAQTAMELLEHHKEEDESLRAATSTGFILKKCDENRKEN